MDPSELAEMLMSIRPSKPARVGVQDLPTSQEPTQPHQQSGREEGETSTDSQRQLLIYRPEGSKVIIEMTEAELKCLNPEEYLNDRVIDFFLAHLRYDTLKREQGERFYIFSTFFHSRLTDSSRDNKDLPNTPERIHDRVKRWSRGVDLFDKDIVVVPICYRSHWYVAFICFPGQFDPETEAPPAKNRAKTAVATRKRKRRRGRGRVSAGRRKKPKPNTPEGALVLSGDSSQSEVLLPKEEEGETPLPSQEEEEKEEEERTGRSQEVQAVSKSDKKLEGMEETHGKGSNMKLGEGEGGEVHEEGGSVEIIEPCIMVLDSLGLRRMAIVKKLRSYLTEEWRDKKPSHPPKDFSSMKAVFPSVLLQDNASDCGIFMLQYVENFLMSVVQGQPLLESNKTEWASYSQTRAKRANIQELILKLSEEQKKQKKS